MEEYGLEIHDITGYNNIDTDDMCVITASGICSVTKLLSGGVPT